MADSEDELLIATSCLLLTTASRLSVTLNLLTTYCLGTKLSEKGISTVRTRAVYYTVIGRRAKVVSCRVGAKPHYSDTTRFVTDLSKTRQTISTCQDGQLPRDFPAVT